MKIVIILIIVIILNYILQGIFLYSGSETNPAILFNSVLIGFLLNEVYND